MSNKIRNKSKITKKLQKYFFNLTNDKNGDI